MATAEELGEVLAARIRLALGARPGLSEQRKMGGVTFLIDGKVCVRAHRDDELMVRCRPERTDELLARPGVRRFEMRGKPRMKGWLLADRSVFEAEGDLAFWIDIGLEACGAAEQSPR